jgi:PIN domain nuclease of toxin-antitoxin system
MSKVVLDASALLALLNSERGAKTVASYLPDAAMSTVNLSEVVAKLAEIGMTESEIQTALVGLQIQFIPFNEDLALQAGLMRPRTRHLGFSLGDRACLALASSLNVKAVTTDSAWTKLTGGPRVELVR